MMDDKRQVVLPPLRPHEIPDTPAVALDLPPEPESFVVPGERMTAEEDRSRERRIALPPLHPSEMPDTLVTVFIAEPDPRMDEPDWGSARRAPEISVPKGKLLRPWDD